MKTITLTQDIEHEGLVAGDVMSVDDLSAASMIDRGIAEAYEAPGGGDTVEPVKTIDDIVDPEVARQRASVLSAAYVGAVDAGPAVIVAADDPGDAAVVADADTGETVSVDNGDGTTTLPATDPADAPDAKAASARMTAAQKKAAASTTPEASAADAAGGDAGGDGS